MDNWQCEIGNLPCDIGDRDGHGVRGKDVGVAEVG
jgi:hypothetical protein